MATETKNLMIDIETLDTRPSALVLSIGAVWFSITPGNIEIRDEFMTTPDIVEQLVVGRTVSRETQKFWSEQEQRASEHWRSPAKSQPLRAAMVELHTFIRLGGDQAVIWANGVTFDITILESLFAELNMSVPWRYNAVRDARTIYKTQPRTHDKDPFPNVEFIAHHPIGDCKMQIGRLWQHGLITDMT